MNYQLKRKIRNFIFTRAVELVEWPFLAAIETCHRPKSAKTCILVESITFGFVIIGWILLDMLLVVLIKFFGQLKSCVDVNSNYIVLECDILKILNKGRGGSQMLDL